MLASAIQRLRRRKEGTSLQMIFGEHARGRDHLVPGSGKGRFLGMASPLRVKRSDNISPSSSPHLTLPSSHNPTINSQDIYLKLPNVYCNSSQKYQTGNRILRRILASTKFRLANHPSPNTTVPDGREVCLLELRSNRRFERTAHQK